MNVYGERQDYRGAYIAIIMRILERLEQGLPPVLFGDGSQTYDFVHVTDCARANVRALASDVSDCFYNVGTGTATTLRQLTELILELTGSELPIQYEPEGKTFVTNRVGSTVKAEREIGFSATVELREGLQRLIQWREALLNPATAAGQE
jgi:UDP-glucose 4-epimerase